MNTHLTYPGTQVQQHNSRINISGEFVIEPDQLTPFVKFNGKQGILLIKGVSTDENALHFYKPVITLIEEHLKTSYKLTCYFFLKDFNQQTAGFLFDTFKILKDYQDIGNKITINWFADWHNHDMIETGVDFSELYQLDMNIMPI